MASLDVGAGLHATIYTGWRGSHGDHPDGGEFRLAQAAWWLAQGLPEAVEICFEVDERLDCWIGVPDDAQIFHVAVAHGVTRRVTGELQCWRNNGGGARIHCR